MKANLAIFKPWHLDAIEMGAPDRAVVARSDVDGFKRTYDGHALTLLAGDMPLGIGWATTLPDDRIEVGLLLSDDLRGRPIMLHRICVRMLVEISTAVANGKSIVARVPIDFVRSRRWVERLGFHHVADHPDGYSLYERTV